jgi:hypothetical protein
VISIVEEYPKNSGLDLFYLYFWYFHGYHTDHHCLLFRRYINSKKLKKNQRMAKARKEGKPRRNRKNWLKNEKRVLENINVLKKLAVDNTGS